MEIKPQNLPFKYQDHCMNQQLTIYLQEDQPTNMYKKTSNAIPIGNNPWQNDNQILVTPGDPSQYLAIIM